MKRTEMLSPIQKQEFLKSRDSFGAEYCDWLKAASFCEQMMDVSGELNRAIDYSEEWQSTGDEGALDALYDEIELISELFRVVYEQDMLPGYHETVRLIEWGIYDYLLWGNTSHQSKRAITGWFDQWVKYSSRESRLAGW